MGHFARAGRLTRGVPFVRLLWAMSISAAPDAPPEAGTESKEPSSETEAESPPSAAAAIPSESFGPKDSSGEAPPSFFERLSKWLNARWDGE